MPGHRVEAAPVGTTYKQAGVDIEAGDALVERIKPLRREARAAREVLSGVGGFGGLFAIPPGKYKEPILVSGTDGVGTKLKLAFALDRHDTVGHRPGGHVASTTCSPAAPSPCSSSTTSPPPASTSIAPRR